MRRAQRLKCTDDEAEMFLTPAAVENLHRELDDLERRQQPRAIQDVSQAVQKGDLSENAEYQEARARLSRIQSRVFSLKDRLKRVKIIRPDGHSGGLIVLGSTVSVQVNSQCKIYRIVGPRESDPSSGRISHVSPLGAALLGHMVGDTLVVQTPNGETRYTILEVI